MVGQSSTKGSTRVRHVRPGFISEGRRISIAVFARGFSVHAGLCGGRADGDTFAKLFHQLPHLLVSDQGSLQVQLGCLVKPPQRGASDGEK